MWDSVYTDFPYETICNWTWSITINFFTTSPVFRPPFEHQTGIGMVVWILGHHLNTGHLNTRQVKVCYSDVSVIQIPTTYILYYLTILLRVTVHEISLVHFSDNVFDWFFRSAEFVAEKHQIWPNAVVQTIHHHPDSSLPGAGWTSGKNDWKQGR